MVERNAGVYGAVLAVTDRDGASFWAGAAGIVRTRLKPHFPPRPFNLMLEVIRIIDRDSKRRLRHVGTKN